MSAPIYERLTTLDHTGKRQTANYRILSEGPKWLRAWKVDKAGETTEDHFKGETLIVVEHLIEKACITKRVPLRMNNHYATLEEAR